MNFTLKKVASGPLAVLIVFGSLLSVYLLQIIPAVWPDQRLQCDDVAPADLPRIVMYGTSWCRFCRKTRWLFEDNDIAYCEYDIETSIAGAEQFKQLGGQAIPLIRIDKEQLHGFNENRITGALRKHGLL